MSLLKKSYRLNTIIPSTLILFLTAGHIAPVNAGVFSVTPVRIYMTPKDRAVAVTITNEGDEELVMQADLYLWKQKPDGEDELTLTEDLFLSPPIIKMAPKSRQVVRLARLNAIKSTDQLSYRVIVREIPEAKPAKEDLQLQIALAFSMPIFITPPNATPKLDCTVEKAAPDSFKAICENTGNAYSHPTQLVLKNSDGVKIASDEAGAYLLPGTKRSFELKSTDAVVDDNIKLTVTFDDATTRDFNLNTSK
jgi:fimbrial chaperone protein